MFLNIKSRRVSRRSGEPKQPKKDMRKEPTDGHYLLNKDTLKAYDRENGYNDYYHKFDKVLKNKH